MKKIYLLLIGTLSIVSTVIGAPRTAYQAHQIAQQLLDKPQAVAYNSSLYIYNNEGKEGFAIISGSDKTRAILGYSDSGCIDIEQIPTNMQDWLHWVDLATTYLESHPEMTLTEAQRNATTTPISPIMKGIEWGQGTPFNGKCPTNCPVGCVATAGSQVIYYYRYPETGIGSHTNSNNSSQTVDFSQANYDYSKMFDKYNRSQTQTQCNEVAKLSYHVGVMSDMRYGTEGSGTFPTNLRRGMVENLGYDPICEVLDRGNYTYEEWQDLLLNELNHNRPIIFTGYCDNGSSGHCFILDGIDSEGKYHVNWGWDGSYNGYYDVAILNPGGVGTGAVMSDDGFCIGQNALIQVAPKGQVEDAVYHSPINAYSKLTLNTSTSELGKSLTCNVTAYNMSIVAQSGYFGIAFVQDGKIVAFSRSSTVQKINYYYGGNQRYNVTIPTTLKDGNYDVFPCFVPNSGDFKGSCGLVRGHVTIERRNCIVKDSKVTFSSKEYSMSIDADDWSFEEEEVIANIKRNITCVITNEDAEHTWSGRYFLCLASPTGKTSHIQADKVWTLAPKQSATLTFPNVIFNEAGTWNAYLGVYMQNLDNAQDDYNIYQATDVFNIEVMEDLTTGAAFSLLAVPELVRNAAYKDSLFINENATFALKLKNTGTSYIGTLRMQLYKGTNATSPQAIVEAKAEIDPCDENTIIISGPLTPCSNDFKPAASGSRYYAKAAFAYSATFKNFSTVSGVSNRLAVTVYSGSPATTVGLDAISQDSTTDEEVYDLLGNRIASGTKLKAGIYIINGKKVLRH